MNRRYVLSVATLSVAMLLAVTSARAEHKKPNGKPAEAAAPAAPEKPYGDWKKLVKDAEVMKGFITLYKKRESLYAELHPEQMGKPVLGIFSFARGIGQNFLLGGLPR